MGQKNISSMREFIESFQDEIITIDKEVDPVCEIAAIQKALEESFGVLFTNIKGYPGVRTVGNLLCRADWVARAFDVDDYKKLKFKCLDAIKKPLASRVVGDAPCQEVVITENIDAMGVMPVIKHSPRDAVSALSGGVTLLSGSNYLGGTDVALKRAVFRDKDWACMGISAGTHLGKMLDTELKGKDVPLTVNISAPPAINMVAGGKFIHSIVPIGSDEVAIAGAIQGSPINLVKAKTVDAFAIADSEWVIEGFIDSSGRSVWESEEAEKAQKTGEFVTTIPEWAGYAGRGHTGYKFHITAITYRKDRPIFFTPLARSYESDRSMYMPINEACYYELAQRIAPGFVTDVHLLPGVSGMAAFVVFQVKKRKQGDEGLQREILAAFLANEQRLALALAVDEDIDIYSARDLLWAMSTRWRGSDVVKIQRSHAFFMTAYPLVAFPEVGVGVDATVQWNVRADFERAHYAADTIDLSKWIPEEKLLAARQMQSEYARFLAETGH